MNIRTLFILCALLFVAHLHATPPDKSKPIEKPAIRNIFQDHSGNYWFATEGKGVIRYDGSSFTSFTTAEGLCSDFVWSVAEDRRGGIWFATRDGICRYDGKQFVKYSGGEQFRDAGYAIAPKKKTTDDLWFGTRDGAYHFNGTQFTFVPLPIDSADQVKRKAQPYFNQTDYSVYSVAVDKKGNVWFGTEQKGVCRFDGRSFTWFREKELASAAVRSIYQDSKGVMWFGNNAEGLFRYDGSSLRNITVEYGLQNPEFRKTLKGKEGTLARVWTITEAANGDLWIGTIDGGIWIYDGKRMKNFSTNDGLPNNSVWTFLKDNKGTTWIGTDGFGVCMFDGKKFRSFTIEDKN